MEIVSAVWNKRLDFVDLKSIKAWTEHLHLWRWKCTPIDGEFQNCICKLLLFGKSVFLRFCTLYYSTTCIYPIAWNMNSFYCKTQENMQKISLELVHVMAVRMSNWFSLESARKICETWKEWLSGVLNTLKID